MFLRKKTKINNSDWSERRENVRGRERRQFRRKDETTAAKIAATRRAAEQCAAAGNRRDGAGEKGLREKES